MLNKTNLHFKFKVLIFPLASENVARNANFNRVQAVRVGSQRKRCDSLLKKTCGERDEEEIDVEGKISSNSQNKCFIP